MKVFAYVDQAYQHATRKVVGLDATIMTSPPVRASEFTGFWLHGYDFIYVDLHGQPGSAYMYSGPDQQYAALSIQSLQGQRLDGATVFATTCHMPRMRFLQAFLDTGALVVAGDGTNWGTRTRVSGAQLLAMVMVGRMRVGMPVDVALRQAKMRLRLSWHRLRDRQATEDALRFELYTKGDLNYGRNGSEKE